MIVVDLDHTICDPTERGIAANGHPNPVYGKVEDWRYEIFYDPERVIKDPVIPGAKECLEIACQRHKIVICSGRRAGCG